MRYTIYTSGTRGDIQPFVPLGQGLRRAGHAVRLATSSNFRPLVEEAGLEFAPVELDYGAMLASPEIQEAFAAGRANILPAMLRLFPRVLHMIEHALTEAWRTAAGTDAVLFTANGAWGWHIAQALQVPATRVCFQPLARSGEVPNAVVMAKPHRFRWVNRLTHVAFELATWLPLRGIFNRWRNKELQLPALGLKPPHNASSLPLLGAYSPIVSPRPGDWPAPWQVVGYWRTDTPPGWQPPPDLASFLQSGPAPVYVGFGSMSKGNQGPNTRLILEVLQKTGRRVLWQAGPAAQEDAALPADVLLIEHVPHAWLFPRMAAVVHHGGSGTTAASLAAGVPTIVVPHGADQFFWGQRVHELGVGPPPLPLAGLTAGRLAGAIAAALSTPAMRDRAGAIGEQIRAEDGVGNAIKTLLG